MKNLTEKQIYLLISALGVILFIPFLGQVHLFDWDEINFAECAREMIATGDYLRMRIDFAPFWEKTTPVCMASGYFNAHIRRRGVRCPVAQCPDRSCHSAHSLYNRKETF